MVGEFTKSFMVQGDINQIFDVITQYFISKDFSLDGTIRPNQLMFSKKGSLLTMDYFKLPQEVVVNLSKVESGGIMVKVHASISGVVKTKGDQSKWMVGITALEQLIKTTVPQVPQTASTTPAENIATGGLCPNCNKPVSPDFAVCPYCSASLNAARACPNCKKELQPEFTVCPYCGTKL